MDLGRHKPGRVVFTIQAGANGVVKSTGIGQGSSDKVIWYEFDDAGCKEPVCLVFVLFEIHFGGEFQFAREELVPSWSWSWLQVWFAVVEFSDVGSLRVAREGLGNV